MGQGRGLVFRARIFSAQPQLTNVRVPGIRLDVVTDRPTRQRRYTHAFERQRTAWFSRGEWQWRGHAANGLNNPATKAGRHEEGSLSKSSGKTFPKEGNDFAHMNSATLSLKARKVPFSAFLIVIWKCVCLQV